MQSSELHCRKATLSDSVETIAKLIHLTDPYIYPAICSDPLDKEWASLILQCLKNERNVFSLDNISVAARGKDTVGIAVVLPCGQKLSFTEGITVPDELSEKVSFVNKGYFVPLAEESYSYSGYNIANFCIDAGCRGQGIGALLMDYCVKEYGESDIHLDVVASNEAAIRLYKKFGFKTVSEYMGFSGDGTDLPCYHMIRTSR